MDVLEGKTDILQLFKEKELVKISAPMVRYSKLPFRLLCREYGTDLCYTPMILADCFHKNAKARDAEFSTNSKDRPLVVQFAANNGIDFGLAAQTVEPFCDGVNINCGCPQRWVLQEKLGAYLINHPELIRDMIKQKQNLCSSPSFTMSVKIRIHDDLKQTIDLVRQIEHAGADYLIIHGRTRNQKSTSSSVNVEAIKLLREQVKIPVVHNGDVFSLEDAKRFQQLTGVNGVMAGRGLLKNPALFAGYDTVPMECVQKFVDIASSVSGVTFANTHHHLMFMLHSVMSKSDMLEFGALTSMAGVVDFLEDRGILR